MTKKPDHKREKAQRNPSPTALPLKPSSNKISDELRQAVKDLGGDEEDLDLIEGIDEGEDESSVPIKNKGRSSDEVHNTPIAKFRS